MVHIHAEGPAFFCWIPKLFGKRVICTIHGLDWAREKWKFGVGSKFIRQGEKNAVKYADEIIVLSKGVQKYFMETYGRSGFVFNIEFLKHGLKISTPLILHGIALNILSQSDRTMITWLADASQTGIYSLIYNFSMIATVITTSLDGVWVPWFTKQMSNKGYKEINKVAVDYVNLMTYAMCCLIMVAPEVVKILASKPYWEGIVIIPPVVLSNYIIFVYTMYISSQYSLDIQALLADWESGNKSRRMILSYDQRIMTGQYPVADLMGYRHTKDGQLVIEPEEAKTVRFIFLAFIQGYDYEQIAMILTQKKRSTLRGRQEWNGMMVANIMKNERRWGDLEARKSIVVDYKLGKVTKNNGNRCSAYVPEHHEAIVSPEIARAAHLVASSKKKCGVQDIVVIQQGALKGFVGIHPNWSGINAESIRSLCLNAYLPEEVVELNDMTEMRSGKKLDMALLSDYLTVSGTCFINQSSPVITISKNGIRFSKACHTRLDDCEHVELLYHPILQVVILRKSNRDASTAIHWENKDKICSSFSSRAFSDTISVPIPQCEESENIPLPDLSEQPENVQRPGSEVVEKGMLT